MIFAGYQWLLAQTVLTYSALNWVVSSLRHVLKPGRPRNTGTPEHPGTQRNSGAPEHRNTVTPEHPGTPNLTVLKYKM